MCPGKTECGLRFSLQFLMMCLATKRPAIAYGGIRYCCVELYFTSVIFGKIFTEFITVESIGA